MLADLDCEFASEDTERSESTDALNQSRPKSVGNSGQANLRGYAIRICSFVVCARVYDLLPKRQLFC